MGESGSDKMKQVRLLVEELVQSIRYTTPQRKRSDGSWHGRWIVVIHVGHYVIKGVRFTSHRAAQALVRRQNAMRLPLRATLRRFRKTDGWARRSPWNCAPLNLLNAEALLLDEESLS